MKKFIKRYFMIFITSILLLSVLVFLIIDFQAKLNSSLKNTTYQFLLEETMHIKATIHAKLDGHFNVLKLTSENLESIDLNDKEKVSDILNDAINSGEFYEVCFIGENGDAINNFGAHKSLQNKSYFKNIIRGDNRVVELINIGEESNNIIMALPYMKDGKVVGAVSGIINSNVLNETLITPVYQGHGAIKILSSKGSIFFSTKQYEMGKEFNNIFNYIETTKISEEDKLKLKSDLKDRRQDTLSYTENNENTLCTYVPLDINDWFIFVSVHFNDISREYNYLQKYELYFGLEIIFVFILLIIYIVWSSRRKRSILISEKEQLQMSEERYRIVTEQTNNVVFEYNIQSMKFHMSDNFTEVFGRKPTEGIFPGNLLNSPVIHPDDQKIFHKLYKDVMNGKKSDKAEMRIQKGDGRYIWCKIILSVLCDENDKPLRVIGEIQNIHKLKHERKLLEKQAKTDSLTGLYNKGTTQLMIETYLQELAENEISAMMILDIDFFKSVNDTYGHIMGDNLLIIIANNIKRLFRSSDIIGRIGGDEFIVFIKQLPDEQKIITKANEVCEAVQNTVLPGVDDLKISASIGVVRVSEKDKSFEGLYRKADLALYEKKRTGRKGCCVYDDSLENENM